MKFYGIYRGDKRIKRYGLHKTYEKAALAFIGPKSDEFFSLLEAELLAGILGYSIKVAKETE